MAAPGRKIVKSGHSTRSTDILFIGGLMIWRSPFALKNVKSFRISD